MKKSTSELLVKIGQRETVKTEQEKITDFARTREVHQCDDFKPTAQRAIRLKGRIDIDSPKYRKLSQIK